MSYLISPDTSSLTQQAMIANKGKHQGHALCSLATLVLIWAHVGSFALGITFCRDDPLINCSFLDKEVKICTTFRDSEEARKYCPRYCGLCSLESPQPHTISANVTTTVQSTQTTLQVTTSTKNQPETSTSGIAVCQDDPMISCRELDMTARICTTYLDSTETRKYCPKYCGLCRPGSQRPHTTLTSVPTTTQAKQITSPATTSKLQLTTSTPGTSVCKDDPTFNCGDLDEKTHICTTFRDSTETQKYCPKYCGLCHTESQPPHSTSTRATTTTYATQTISQGTISKGLQDTTTPGITFCHDDPVVSCPILDKDAQICTMFRDSIETRKYCPKYCGLCHPGKSSGR